jgi:formate hydrogenlyase subunit 6/NADH:ubiquinone oxidoreductase subunit I
MKHIGVRSPKPAVCQERCSRVLFFGVTCDKCLAGCPTSSISIGYPFLTIDHTCSGCGFCVALCPNEVFVLREDNRGIGDDSGKPDRLCCSGLLAQPPMPLAPLPSSIIPCLGSISASSILRHVLRTEKPLEVVTGSCCDCSLKAGEESYRLREKELRTLFDYLHIGFPPANVSVGSAGQRQSATGQYKAFQLSLEEKKTLSRRDFFKRLRESAVPYKAQTGKNEVGAGGDVPGGRETTSVAKLRSELFRKYGQGKLQEAGAIPGLSEVEVDEVCTGCGACANLCPTGALTIEDAPESARLLWTPAHCSQCSLCLDVCPRKALHHEPCVDAGRIAGETVTVIKEFHRHLCPECGKSYLSSGTESLCSDCTKARTFMDAVSAMICGEEREAVQ